MDIQATRLWQGRGIDVEELNRQIVTFVSIMKQKVQKFFTLGIDFPTEYAEVALEHLKQNLCVIGMIINWQIVCIMNGEILLLYCKK